MKFILDGGWYKNDENSVKRNIIARYIDFLLESLKQEKKLLIVTNAKSVGYYKDSIYLLSNSGAEVVGRDTREKVEWGKYDIILVLGGETKILYNELLNMGFEMNLLKESVIYIGSSAGAQIMGSYFYNYDRENKHVDFIKGFTQEDNTIYLVHSDNTLYVDDFLKNSLKKFIEENNLNIIPLKENQVIEK